MKCIAITCIRMYQLFISPLWMIFPGCGCRFPVSCSEYMLKSIKNDGVLKGAIAGLRRVISCNPWS